MEGAAAMIDYETFLVKVRDAGAIIAENGSLSGTDDKELIHNSKLKTIKKSINLSFKLKAYLSKTFLCTVMDTEEAEAIAQQLVNKEWLGLDIETGKTDPEHPLAGLNPLLSQIRLIQIYDGHTCYVFDQYKIKTFDWLTPLLDNQIVAHNAVFEASHFLHQGITFNNLHDSMLMGRVFLNENKRLKDLALDALNLPIDKTLQVSDWNRDKLLQEQIEYAAADAVIAFELKDIFLQWMEENESHYQASYRFLKELIYPLTRQLLNGVPFDKDRHQQLINQWEEEQAEARALIKDIENPRSAPQKQKWLESVLTDNDLYDWPTTPTGNLSTSKDVLEQAHHIPEALPLAKYTSISSKLSNFGKNLQDMIINDRIYPGYQIAGMVSGRFSCRKPNIQNIPRSGFKACFKAPPGYVFITGDLSQIELRVAGIISGDETINQGYREGKDLHRSMAANMTGKPEDQITKSERTAAKAVNFGLLFGAGAATLRLQAINSYHVDMDIEEAEHYKDVFKETYSQLADWQEEIVKETNIWQQSKSHFVQLTRHYDHDVYTHAMNYPIQSSAWEVLALAIKYIDQTDPHIKISHHVYDELTLLVPEHKKLEAAQLLKDAFYYGFKTCFPDAPDRNLVEIGAGITWEEAGEEENIIRGLV